MWVRAMHKYHTVALSVAPKRAALAEAQSQLDATLAELAAAQSKLQVRFWVLASERCSVGTSMQTAPVRQQLVESLPQLLGRPYG